MFLLGIALMTVVLLTVGATLLLATPASSGEDPSSAPARFQFTIYDALRATAWGALTSLAWLNAGAQWSLASRGLANPAAQAFALAVVAFSIVGPFVTLASLFRRTWIGWLVGGGFLLLAIPVALAFNC